MVLPRLRRLKRGDLVVLVLVLVLLILIIGAGNSVVGTSQKEDSRSLRVPTVTCPPQCRAVPHIHIIEILPSQVLDKQSHHTQVTLNAGLLQGRDSIHVPCSDISPSAQQEIHYLLMTTSHSPE
jgi:hypothetical protein